MQIDNKAAATAMSFRKRNIGVSQNTQNANISTTNTNADAVKPALIPGTRPSPIDGRPVTSTGTSSLDALFAGHSGFPLGNSLLVEENGPTDYAGALVKYYAAEGVVQGHRIYVIGVPEHWGRELPEVVQGDAQNKHQVKGGMEDERSQRNDKMKIAWRYEKQGQFGSTEGARRVDRGLLSGTDTKPTDIGQFNHKFDLTKRLTHPGVSSIICIPLPQSTTSSPFSLILQQLAQFLFTSQVDTIHRVVIPGLLSPALYPVHASEPGHLLSLIHGLRSLLRQHPANLTVMLTLPLSLYPRQTGLVRWMEHLVDGVMELTPFPHSSSSELGRSGASTKEEEKPQGLLKIHKLPVFHERGGGSAGKMLGEDMAFTVSRRKFEIKPFSLPPTEGDTEAQAEREGSKIGDVKSMEF